MGRRGKILYTPPEIKPPEMAGWGQERLVAAGHRATKQVHDLVPPPAFWIVRVRPAGSTIG